MFRSKIKSGGASRKKRRDVEVGGDADGPSASVEIAGVPDDALPVASDAEAAGHDLQGLEQLRWNRRARPVKSVMTFSSKSASVKSSGSSSRDGVYAQSQQSDASTRLSFEDGEETAESMATTTSTKKRKMRPNIVVYSTRDVKLETRKSGCYSAEMLATLKSEQSVLLSRHAEMDVIVEVEKGNEEREASSVHGREEEEFIALDGRTKTNRTRKSVTFGAQSQDSSETGASSVQDREEEEFIALDGRTKTTRTRKSVTFGTQLQDSSRSETAEVMDEVSDGGEEEEEQSRRWEEELMRRAGQRVSRPSDDPSGSRLSDGQPIYPTRKKVTCVSLGTVLGKLEKSAESTLLERERASRELARLEAETALIETALVQQQEELRTSSEEFEYFQDVGDFVEGLSSCLRAKVPIIEATRNRVVQSRICRVQDKRKEEQYDVAEAIKRYIGSGNLEAGDIMGLNQSDVQSSAGVSAASSMQDSARATRLRKSYQAHFNESYVTDERHMEDDLFADAIDEFSSLEHVCGRFQEWKAKFAQVYEDVFCELAQEKLFAPYVQAELLYWDPLGVADAPSELAKCWSLDDFAWYRALHRHVSKASDDTNGGHVDGPILYQLRHVLLENVRVAVSSYYDPYSSLQARSLAQVLDELDRRGYAAHVEGAVQAVVKTVLETVTSETKRTVLIALDRDAAASSDDVHAFARYLLEKFTALQDNLLTLFVALPRGPLTTSAFRCLLYVLRHLLAYVRHCHETQKTHLVAMATQVVRQLAGSSYVLELLSDPSQERELQHVLDLFASLRPPVAQANLSST
ncbi:unnamed protein product [Hyaloperonospora brassicae]|uniref:GCF C-terminal domain-containing protein n=1 Tax=Hyaloperonospora brassicae TaxID=162125 RepID=A0AAV0UD89_HYABA|nr:unnamed protein product [Hyaloperonospora brassicae]